MKMSIVPLTATGGRPEMMIEHGERQLFWNVSCFDKKTFSDMDVCVHINGYWEKLSFARQEKVFEIYQSIRNIFEDFSETGQLINQLLPKVSELLAEHTLEEVSHYIAFHAGMSIQTPASFQDAYTPNEDRPSTREKTYTRPDYVQLVALALALRVMIPVWAEFIHRTKNDTGTNFKEYYAYQLLGQSKLVHSAPMEKLKTYVEHNIKSDKSMGSAIMSGVGSEDYPGWLLALVLVRRLCVGEISGVDQQTNLVTFIYNFIIYKVSGNTSTAFGESIRDKEFESGDSNNEHNASRIEGYKIKQESSIGDMMILEHYMENPFVVAQQLKPDMDMNLLQSFLEASQQLLNERLTEGQVILTQLVLSPVMSPRGIPHLSKKKTVTAIAIAQTWLWEQGHKELAVLVSAIASSSQDQMYLGSTDSRGRIPRELMEKLNKLWPYARVSSARQRTKPANAVVQAIDKITGHLSQRDWILTVPDQQAAEVTGNQSLRRYSCPYDIRTLLAQLAIQLAEAPKREGLSIHPEPVAA